MGHEGESDEEIIAQQKLHEAITETLTERGDLPEGQLLAGWVLCYETVSMSEKAAVAGHIYGPREMTVWRALGLVEWASRYSLGPGESDDEDDD